MTAGSGRFATLARDNHVWLTGSMLESQGDQFYNTMALYSPEGKLAASYRKIHLFRLMNEEKYLAPGGTGVMHELPWGWRGGWRSAMTCVFPSCSGAMRWRARV